MAYALPYDLLPSKVAMIWYVPSAGGVQVMPYEPPMSLVAVPIS